MVRAEQDSAVPDGSGQLLRLGVVPGVNPGRWADTWRGRHRDVPLDLVPLDAADAEDALLSGTVDAAFLRLPLGSPGLVRIPLWTEETVVAMSGENELTLLDEVTPEDLAAETLVVPADDVLRWARPPGQLFAGLPPLTTADALDLVAHEAGVCVLPRAIARELHRRDVELRPLVAAADTGEAKGEDDDAESHAVPASQVGLAWLPETSGEPSSLVEQLIGIVRGRSINSTRGPRAEAPPASPAARPRQSRQAARGTRQRPARPARGRGSRRQP